jgi:hypothetical protein
MTAARSPSGGQFDRFLVRAFGHTKRLRSSRFASPTAAVPLKGAPWLCHVTYHVNGQLVTTKCSRLPHVAGCGGAFVVTAGAAFVIMMLSADASVAYAAPASPRIIAVETLNFFILPLPTGSNMIASAEIVTIIFYEAGQRWCVRGNNGRRAS